MGRPYRQRSASSNYSGTPPRSLFSSGPNAPPEQSPHNLQVPGHFSPRRQLRSVNSAMSLNTAARDRGSWDRSEPAPPYDFRNIHSPPVGFRGSFGRPATSGGAPGGASRFDHDISLVSSPDVVDDRTRYAVEFNRIASMCNMDSLTYEAKEARPSTSDGKRKPPLSAHGLFARVLRAVSHAPPPEEDQEPAPNPLARRRSVSDMALGFVQTKKELPASMDLDAMARLSGRSVLRLPGGYANGPLVLPTCIRATAHFLAQHSASPGIFRVPGSARVVGALLEHYCYADPSQGDVSDVIRNPDLPTHIRVHEHDVASTFKRLLGAIPGGILGSQAIFDALVSVRVQLWRTPDVSDSAARMIALAIGSIGSLHRRDLVCAVFGLLALVGDVAEATALQSDYEGRSRSDNDLMGYQALGVVFGPLLVGGLLQDQLVTVPPPPPPSSSARKNRARSRARQSEPPANSLVLARRVLEANKVAQMLVTHWRMVVQHMHVLGVYRGAPFVLPEDYHLVPEVDEIGRHSAMAGFDIGRRPATAISEVSEGERRPATAVSEVGEMRRPATAVSEVGEMGRHPAMTAPLYAMPKVRPGKVDYRSATAGAVPHQPPQHYQESDLMPMKRLRPRGPSARMSDLDQPNPLANASSHGTPNDWPEPVRGRTLGSTIHAVPPSPCEDEPTRPMSYDGVDDDDEAATGSVIVGDVSRETSIDSVLTLESERRTLESERPTFESERLTLESERPSTTRRNYEIESGWTVHVTSRDGAEFTRPEIPQRSAAELNRPTQEELFSTPKASVSIDLDTWPKGSPRSSSRIPRAVQRDEGTSPWNALRRKMSRPRLVEKERVQMPSVAGTF